MSTATSQRLSRRLAYDRRVLWYVPDPRLRTRLAADRAAEIASWINCEPRTEPPPDEVPLFVALHTCAFRARRAGQCWPTGAAQRRRWIRRWKVIREYIVAENLGLAYTMITRFRVKDFDHDDLLSEAMFALARAVDRFNPWRGFRFSTYACNVIARALIRRGKTQMRYRRLFPLQSEGLFDRVERGTAESDVYVERLRRAVVFNLGGLTEMESTVLSKRFPADRDDPLTFRQIGKVVGLSKERVRQIQAVALTKLREVLRVDPLLV